MKNKMTFVTCTDDLNTLQLCKASGVGNYEGRQIKVTKDGAKLNVAKLDSVKS